MNKKETTFALAGHTFSLKDVQYGIHSEETCDYIADIYADDKHIGEASNDGHGGMTFVRGCPQENIKFAEQVRKDVEAQTRFVCNDGTKIHWYLGNVADMILILMEKEKEARKAAAKKHPKKGMKKFTVGVYLPLSYCTEVWAKNEEEAKEAALEEALQTPFNDWDDDFSKAYAELLNDPNAPGLR